MSRATAAGSPLGYAWRGPIILLMVVVTLYLARALLIPIAFALTLTFLVAPATARLERRGVPRAAAVGIVSALICGCILLGAYVVSRQLIDVAQALPEYRGKVQRRVAALHSPAEATMEKAMGAIEGMSGDFVLPRDELRAAGGETPTGQAASAETHVLPVRVVDGGRGGFAAASDLLAKVVRPVGEIGIVLIFTIYMLMKREELRHRLLLLAGMGHINLMSRAIEDATGRVSRYLIMQIEVNACYGLFFGVGLALVGVPNAILWGVIAGVLRIVPYVGTAVALILPLIVSIAVSTSWLPPLLVLAVFFVLETTAANFVEPWLYSSRTGISSLALLGMAIFWTTLWGWPGLVLSTPLTVCMVVIGRYVPQMGFLNILLGTNAELSPSAHYYERLLAMDEKGAREIAERFLSGKPLVELYDEVIIPALAMAEEDRHKGGLGEARSNFVFLSVGELVARLSGYRQRGIPAPDKSEMSMRLEELKGSRKGEFAVVCVSAGDRADELTTMMLTQLMERAGHPTLMLSSEAVSEEILAGLAQEPGTVVVISALPPFAFAQAQAICQRVRGEMKKNRVVVGLWNAEEDMGELGERFGSGRPDCVVRTLGGALGRVGG